MQRNTEDISLELGSRVSPGRSTRPRRQVGLGNQTNSGNLLAVRIDSQRRYRHRVQAARLGKNERPPGCCREGVFGIARRDAYRHKKELAVRRPSDYTGPHAQKTLASVPQRDRECSRRCGGIICQTSDDRPNPIGRVAHLRCDGRLQKAFHTGPVEVNPREITCFLSQLAKHDVGWAGEGRAIRVLRDQPWRRTVVYRRDENRVGRTF